MNQNELDNGTEPRSVDQQQACSAGEWLECHVCGHVAFYEHHGLCEKCMKADTGRMEWADPPTNHVASI